MKKKIMLALILCLSIVFTSGCGAKDTVFLEAKDSLSHEGYELEQVVVLSRHNIRAPLCEKGSTLDTMTSHKWIDWTSNASELSVRGGVLETEMGQYFRKWLEKEELFPENYIPSDEEVRIYANSKQRTIATSEFFKAGLLPVANSQVEYHMEFDKMDPVFTPQFTFVNDDYADDVRTGITDRFGEEIEGLKDNYKLLEKVIDVRESEAWKNGDFKGFDTQDSEFIIKEGEEPGVKGSLKTACQLSDALVLQYYEAEEGKAAFGKKVSEKDWEDIAEIKDVYGDVLFTLPSVAANVANPLLKEIDKELNTEGRKFTFLCGHDSNIGSVLAAMRSFQYSLPEAIEKKTPIGCKLVFTKWKGGDGEEYIGIDLVYQSVDQLRGMSLLDEKNPPMIVPMSFVDLEINEDGLYYAEDVEEMLEEAIEAYDVMKEDYKEAA